MIRVQLPICPFGGTMTDILMDKLNTIIKKYENGEDLDDNEFRIIQMMITRGLKKRQNL